MPRSFGTLLLEAIELASQGKAALEIMAMGYDKQTAYRAVRVAKYGSYSKLVSQPRPAHLQASSGAPQSPSSIPKIDSTTEKYLKGAGIMVVDQGDEADAEQVILMTRAQRIPMPVLLPRAIVATKMEWGWESMPARDFIDTIIYRFFREHGILLGAYYTFEELGQFKEVQDASKRGIRPPVGGGEGDNGSGDKEQTGENPGGQGEVRPTPIRGSGNGEPSEGG